MEHHERREHPRHRTDQQAAVRLLDNGDVFPCVVTDVSKSGVGFIACKAFPEAHFMILVSDDESASPSIIQGKVIRVDHVAIGVYRHGAMVDMHVAKSRRAGSLSGAESDSAVQQRT